MQRWSVQYIVQNRGRTMQTNHAKFEKEEKNKVLVKKANANVYTVVDS